MKYKILDNKKGIGIDDAVPLVIFFFIAAFGVFLFNVNEKVKGQRLISDIQFQKDILNGHEILIEYITKIDEQGNRAEFIAKSYLEKDYDKIKKDMKEYFDIKLANFPAWYIDLVDSSQQEIFSIQSDNYHSAHDQLNFVQITSIHVPVNSQQSMYLQIKLFTGRLP